MVGWGLQDQGGVVERGLADEPFTDLPFGPRLFVASEREGTFDDEGVGVRLANIGSAAARVHCRAQGGERLRRRRPLARRELHWSFKALVDRIDSIWFAEGKNDFSYHPHYLLRAMKSLHIEFKAK